jgi:LAS superfamily LD-carboxypeptidase LdcB
MTPLATAMLALILLTPPPLDLPDRGEPLTSTAYAEDLVDAGFSNGMLPAEALVEVPTSQKECLVEVEAAEAWEALLVHAAHDGIYLEAGWCYRSLAAQRRTYVRNCGSLRAPKSKCVNPTATPGNSNHGWGRAIDVTTYRGRLLTCRSTAFRWLEENAHLYGWVHPAWAGCGRPLEEAWHWEWGGTNEVQRAVSSFTTAH